MLIQGKYRCINCFRVLGNENEACSCGFKKEKYVSQPHYLNPGTVLDNRYCLGRVIGEGGFGITYVGYDINLDIKIAVKEFYINGYNTRNVSQSTDISLLSSNKQEFFETNREKFINEARLLAKFNNEAGVVSVLNFLKANNTAYIIMEFVEGKTLKQHIQEKGILTIEEICKIFFPIISTLGKIHSTKLIHRDISPDNIILTGDGGAKLIDFGAARNTSAEEKSLSVVLKHGYAPMEQYSTHGNQGPWTDVYALCATIYKCLTKETPTDAAARAGGAPMRPPTYYNENVPKAVSLVLMKGMYLDYAQRIQSMAELGNELKHALGAPVEQQVAEKPKPAPIPEAPKEAKKDKDKQPDDKKKETEGKNKLPILAAVIVLLVLVGAGAGYFLLGNKSGKTNSSASTDGTSTEQLTSAETVVTDDEGVDYVYGEQKECLVIDENNILCGLSEKGQAEENLDLVIPNTVVGIQDGAFKRCANIVSLNYEKNSNLSYIGNSAFADCTNLASAKIPPTTETLGEYCFANTGITSIKIPQSVMTVYRGAFNASSKLSSVTLESSVTGFARNDVSYFEGCSILNVTWGKGVTKIPEGMFNTATFASNATVTIPSAVTEIGALAFINSNISSVVFEEGSALNSIYDKAFANCSKLSGFVIPDKVEYIGKEAFCGASAISEITIPAGVKTVDERAFAATGISSITFPATLQNVMTGVCKDCSKLAEVTFESDNTLFMGEGQYFEGCALKTVNFGKEKTRVDNNLFKKAKFRSNAEVKIPKRFTSIGDCAFESSNINGVSFESDSSLAEIGYRAFGDCSSITAIEIPNSVRNIGDYAFEATMIKRIVFPESVQTVGTGVCKNCTKLREVTLLSNEAQFSGKDFFLNAGITSIYFGEKVDSIPDSMFYAAGFSSTSNIVIPDSITYIGGDNFYSCSNWMKSVSLPAGTVVIKNGAFRNVPGDTQFIVTYDTDAYNWAVGAGVKIKVEGEPEDVTGNEEQ